MTRLVSLLLGLYLLVRAAGYWISRYAVPSMPSDSRKPTAASIRDVIEAPPGEPVSIDHFAVDELADGVVLATYLIRGEPSVNRSSIWVRRDGRWVIRFHQGTPRGD